MQFTPEHIMIFKTGEDRYSLLYHPEATTEVYRLLLKAGVSPMKLQNLKRTIEE